VYVCAFVAFVGCDDSSGVGGSGGKSSTASSSKASSSSKAVVTVSTGSSNPGPGLGAVCQSDADCGTLTCLKSSDDLAVFGGGPGNGYCSSTCATDDDCPGGVCLGTGPDARCVESCILGDPMLMYLDSDLDRNKCHGREDVRCQTVDSNDICVPTCRSDADCDGRKCDPRLAACVDTPNTGLPRGDFCDPNHTPPDCAGVCVTFNGGGAMCSNWCTLGGPDLDAECGGLTSGLCVFSPTGHELGDAAFCTEACSLQSDCQNPMFWCQGINGITGAQVPNGFCFGTADCPNGQSQCTSPFVCTPTKYGPKCLDTAFPLGDAGTGGAGGGGATSSSSTTTVSSSSDSSSSASDSSSSTGP
jgi:hypothetical protein